MNGYPLSDYGLFPLSHSNSKISSNSFEWTTGNVLGATASLFICLIIMLTFLTCFIHTIKKKLKPQPTTTDVENQRALRDLRLMSVNGNLVILAANEEPPPYDQALHSPKVEHRDSIKKDEGNDIILPTYFEVTDPITVNIRDMLQKNELSLKPVRSNDKLSVSSYPLVHKKRNKFYQFTSKMGNAINNLCVSPHNIPQSPTLTFERLVLPLSQIKSPENNEPLYRFPQQPFLHGQTGENPNHTEQMVSIPINADKTKGGYDGRKRSNTISMTQASQKFTD